MHFKKRDRVATTEQVGDIEKGAEGEVLLDVPDDEFDAPVEFSKARRRVVPVAVLAKAGPARGPKATRESHAPAPESKVRPIKPQSSVDPPEVLRGISSATNDALFAIGGTLITGEELAFRAARGELDHFQRAVAAGHDAAELRLSTGRPTVRRVKAMGSGHAADARNKEVEFSPIGLGKPLLIEILTIYTGKVPTFLLRGQDVLVTSAIKAIQTFDAAPRGVNQLLPKPATRTRHRPSALSTGSPLVFYTPALADPTTLCSVELIADRFPEEVFTQVAGLFGAAGGLPVFAPASLYLLGASYVAKIAGKLGEALLDGSPFLSGSLRIGFDTPTFDISIARNAVVVNAADRQRVLNDYCLAVKKDAGGESYATLVRKDDESVEYIGDSPYVVLSLDGRAVPAYEGYSSRLTSAALLERFYGRQDASGQVVEVLGDAMRLYNDFAFAQRADRMQLELKRLPTGSPAAKKAQQMLDAYVANIQDEKFRPKSAKPVKSEEPHRPGKSEEPHKPASSEEAEAPEGPVEPEESEKP